MKRVLALAFATLATTGAFAVSYTQDFEGFGTGGPFGGGSTGGYPIDISFYPEAGDFSIVDLTGVPGWGSRSILPNTSVVCVMRFNFSMTLDFVSMEMGDFDADDDDLFLEAYSGADATGTLLGSDSEFYAASRDISTGDIATLSVAAAGINSIRVWSTGFGGVSNLYMDNLHMESPVPEPATLAVLGLGGLALIRRRNKK